MPDLLFEIGCEELPARACREALEQLPALVEAELGTAPATVWAGPRRLVVRVDGLPERTPDAWVKGPPVALREKAAAGFAKRHGVDPWLYLEHVLTALPGRRANADASDLLPDVRTGSGPAGAARPGR